MIYEKLVYMWNEESEENWNNISEKRKVEFAFDEGRRTGFIKMAEVATKLSESERDLLD
jgi:hypothetical protein